MSSLPLRMTVAPDEDVEFAPGRRFAEVRRPLARALGRGELAERELFAGSTPIDDDALTGHPPLLSGAVLTTTARPRSLLDVARRADDAPWQFRVTNGPDAGWVLPLDRGLRIRVTARTGGAGDGGITCGPVRLLLELADPALVGREFVIRLTRRGPQFRARRRLGTLRGLRSHPRRRTDGVVGLSWWWRRLAPGSALVVGGSVFDVSSTSEPVAPVEGRTGSDIPPAGSVAPVRSRGAWMLLLPVVGSLVMAFTMRQPLFALMALMGPVMMISSRFGRRHSAPGASTQAPVPGGTAQERTAYAGPVSLVTAIRSRHGLERPQQMPRALALLGARGRAHGRALVCLYAAAGFQIIVVGSSRALVPWQETRWLPGAHAVSPDELPSSLDGQEPTLVVAVSPWSDGWLAHLSQEWSRAHSHVRVLFLDSDAAQVPAWATRTTPGGGLTPESFETVARAQAAAGVHQPRSPDASGHRSNAEIDKAAHEPHEVLLPSTVSLAAQLGAPEPVGRPGSEGQTAAWVQSRWSTSPPGLQTVLGQGPGGRPVLVDLPSDGPHALVAGTTGAGKSEFLQTLICSLALTYSPRDLAIALVDYKGGASFGVCAELPHVVGLVTDLEPGLARRALSGLQAELMRRERLLASVGVADLDAFRASASDAEDALPRLMIVVDEFRAMADDLPDFLPGLLRIAAQGRSLGIHLVLATQRPGGAVNADMRANIGLRVCLRVTDPTDSRDVIDSPAAAALPASAPGRAVMVTTRQSEQTFQSGYAPAPHPDADSVVRRAPEWSVQLRSAERLRGDETRTLDVLGSLVAGAAEAARAAGIAPPAPVWLPALPHDLAVDEDVVNAADSFGSHLPVALLDIPAEQRRGWGHWELARGHLVIEGGSGSGRTTALRTLAHGALERGCHVHIIGRAGEFSDLLAHEGIGTVVDADDPRRVAALLQHLGQSQREFQQRGGLAEPHSVVLIDDIEELLTSLSALARGAGADILTTALRLPRSLRVHMGLATARPLPSSLAALVAVRLVLASSTKHDDIARGVPASLAGLGGPPGRAVWFGSPEPLIGQVPIADSKPPRAADRRHGVPLRIQPIPHHVDAHELRRSEASDSLQASLVVVGRGGHDAGARALDVSRGALIAGPHGSGRSNVLALIQQGLDSERCLVIARDGPLLDLPAAIRVSEFSGPHLAQGLNDLRELQQSSGAPPWTILLDDGEALIQACPLEAEQLTRANRPARLIAAATTSGAASALRGPLAELRSMRTGIILDPATPGSADIFGAPLTWLIEPGLSPPGRGVLVHGRDLKLLQVASVLR